MMIPSFITPTPPDKALIFDCDGTLANTLPVHFQTWSAALEAVGIIISEDWYYQHCGISAVEMLQLFQQTFGDEFDSEVKEVKAIAEIVHNYYGRIPMAVASGRERTVLEATLAAIKLDKFFNAIVSANDVKPGEPQPDLF